MIRIATEDDYPILHRMGQAFFDASGYGELCTYDKQTMEQTFDTLLDQESLLTDGENGMIGFLVFPLFMNSSCLVSQELFWWVDADKRSTGLGVKLLKAAEKKSREIGATKMLMLCLDLLDGDRVEKLYLKMGYEPRERTYVRSL